MAIIERDCEIIMKYTIIIEETIAQEFDIEANNFNEAIEKGILKYKNSEFIVENSEVQHKQIAVVNPDTENTEWVEF